MKPWTKSRTIWLGLATVATAVVSALAGGAGWHEVVLGAVGAINVWLRTQTTQPIGE